MDLGLFQKITSNELDRFVHELDAAIESHIRWLADVNRSLICHTPPAPQDLAEAPHLACRFGRWYHGMDNAELKGVSEFRAMESVHRELHAAARTLLQHDSRGEPVPVDEYDRLVHLSERLRALIAELRTGLKLNLHLLTKLTGKVFENASEGVVITDLNGSIMNVNRAFTRVTGYSKEEVLGKNPSLLYSGRQDAAFYQAMWKTLKETGQWRGEIWNRRKNGEIYPEHLSIAAVSDDENRLTYYVGIFSDITSEKENEKRLYRLAHYDQLTDLPNRMLFFDRLRQALRRAKRDEHMVAVLFLDLDGFKRINDRHGHGVGDELLRQVARRLESCLRESDTVGRFGGDEFTIVLGALESADGAVTVARKIIDCIGRPYRLGEHEGHVTTSVGISLYPLNGRDPEVLIGNADVAMYEAKSSGKNRYCLFRPM